MTTIINWNDINNEKPFESGWYMVVLQPVNHREFIDCPSEMNDWISAFGINKMWFNNGEFWGDRCKITDRVIYWGDIPSVPLY